MVINNIAFNTDLETILFELRNQLSVNNVLLLQKMKPTSTHVMVQCPYHNNGQERRPSAGIRKDDGLFHCFTCNEVHTLQEVISYCFGYTDDIVGKFGWNWLLKNFATVQVEERKDVRLDFGRDRTIDSNIFNKQFVTEEELDKYRYIHPYMYERGLTDEVIELFDIGFDKDTQCLTFPVRDIKGNCLFVARRSVKTKFFNYPEGVEKPLYGLYEYYTYAEWEYGAKHNMDCSEVIVCESMLDALSFWTVGKYAVALNGLGNDLQFKQLRELPCRKIILATDMDERGQLARKRIKQNLWGSKLVTEYFFPKGRKDANECTKEELINLEDVL